MVRSAWAEHWQFDTGIQILQQSGPIGHRWRGLFRQMRKLERAASPESSIMTDLKEEETFLQAEETVWWNSWWDQLA